MQKERMSHPELISCVFTLQYAALKQMGTCPIDIFFFCNFKPLFVYYKYQGRKICKSKLVCDCILIRQDRFLQYKLQVVCITAMINYA